MGGVYHELDYALDEPIWHGILLGDQYGILGRNGRCFTDRCLDECGILEFEA